MMAESAFFVLICFVVSVEDKIGRAAGSYIDRCCPAIKELENGSWGRETQIQLRAAEYDVVDINDIIK